MVEALGAPHSNPGSRSQEDGSGGKTLFFRTVASMSILNPEILLSRKPPKKGENSWLLKRMGNQPLEFWGSSLSASRLEGFTQLPGARSSLPFAEEKICLAFSLVVNKGMDFTTGRFSHFCQGA